MRYNLVNERKECFRSYRQNPNFFVNYTLMAANDNLLLNLLKPVIIIMVFTFRPDWSEFKPGKWIKKTYKKIATFLQIQYYAIRGENHHEEIVWKLLKKELKIVPFKHEVKESEKTVYTKFHLAPDILGNFWYMMYSDRLYFRAAIIPNYPVEQTTNIFILAQHFNNQVNHGSVVVDVRLNYIEFRTTYHFPEIIFTENAIQKHITHHYKISCDIFWAFNKMLTENEEPAYIIAELIAKREGVRSTDEVLAT